MKRSLVITILNAYAIFNNGSLTIVTDSKVFNGCRVNDIDLSLVYISNKDDKLYRIKLDDIIGIQFIDEAAVVGMK